MGNQKKKQDGVFQVPNDEIITFFLEEFPELLKFELPTIYLDFLVWWLEKIAKYSPTCWFNVELPWQNPQSHQRNKLK